MRNPPMQPKPRSSLPKKNNRYLFATSFPALCHTLPARLEGLPIRSRLGSSIESFRSSSDLSGGISKASISFESFRVRGLLRAFDTPSPSRRASRSSAGFGICGCGGKYFDSRELNASCLLELRVKSERQTGTQPTMITRFCSVISQMETEVRLSAGESVHGQVGVVRTFVTYRRDRLGLGFSNFQRF